MSGIPDDEVAAVVIEVTCRMCWGKCYLPGGRYEGQGEVLRCIQCNGRGRQREAISIEQLRRIVSGPGGGA